jgi:hypothetical protein
MAPRWTIVEETHPETGGPILHVIDAANHMVQTLYDPNLIHNFQAYRLKLAYDNEDASKARVITRKNKKKSFIPKKTNCLNSVY